MQTLSGLGHSFQPSDETLRTSTFSVIYKCSYSRTSRYGHLSNKDTSILRTVFNVQTELSYIFF